MKLHENTELFNDAVIATAQLFKIPEIYIEKDYWVTVALKAIFNSNIKEEVVFKGGTALSKCFKIVERFSEDVDIVVLSKEGESGNKLKNKLKAVTEAVAKQIPEVEVEGVTNKLGMIRKTAHQYNRLKFQGTWGQIREQVIVEATWMGSSEPFTTGTISCYIIEMMKNQKQEQLIAEYQLQPFNVKVLSKARTFCEKIMSLVRFSQTEEPYTSLSNKIRHVYDLHLLLKDEETRMFAESSDFDTLLNTVGSDDVIGYKNNNKWLINHPANAIIFSQSVETWDKIKIAYRTSFRDLVLGPLPAEDEIVATLKNLHQRIHDITWKVKPQ